MADNIIDFNPTLLGEEPLFYRFCKNILQEFRNKSSDEKELYLKDQKEQLTKSNSFKTLSESSLSLVFAKSLLLDLLFQDWELRVRGERIWLEYPVYDDSETDLMMEKERVRKRHLFARDMQLSEKSVVDFINRMERRHLTAKGWHSIFSLMRDGALLSQDLTRADLLSEPERHNALQKIISPYIQVVEIEKRCEHTGLFLSDIWRYFRHTWVNEYKSLPGRSISILIRDAAYKNHPIIGIAALGSSVAQQNVRDNWIGWSSSSFINKISESPLTKYSKWLIETLNGLIKEIYVSDLVSEKILSAKDLKRPSPELISSLRKKSVEFKKNHHKFPHHSKFNSENNSFLTWKKRAQTFLFKSKRCQALADLLSIKNSFQSHGLINGTRSELREAINYSPFLASVGKLIRKAKGKRVGINMMDIIVCGSIAPYNHLLGGKLVCMLLTSPEIVEAYQDRYRESVSLIASSMNGKATVRKPKLVFLGTTSLYGIGSSQYNRIKIPASEFGGEGSELIEYKNLGYSEGYGSFHLSKETLKLGNILVGRRKGGKRVNSIFGEGANPLIRKIRESFENIGLDPDPILNHGNKRIVYGIPLAKNFREFLMGFEKTPKYIIPVKKVKEKSDLISMYWIKRWLSKRIQKSEVLESIRQHTLSYPITHGAKVPLIPKNQEAELELDFN